MGARHHHAILRESKMIWASHLTVGYALASVTGMNPVAVGIGAILPDLVEKVPGTHLRHRGISHSLALHAVILTLFASIPPLRDAWIGVVVAHLLCDALSPTGIPVFLEGGQNLVLFGGRLRVGSPMELALAAGILLLALVVQPGSEGSFLKRSWGKLYEDKVIDKREYLEHRFWIF